MDNDHKMDVVLRPRVDNRLEHINDPKLASELSVEIFYQFGPCSAPR